MAKSSGADISEKSLLADTSRERSPLAPGEGTWSVFAMKVVAERDAARAEVERLQKERDAACMAAGEYSQDEVNAMTTDMIAVREEAERAAYQRGAEAMREAAARLAYAQLAHTLTDIHEKIRALPLPEDKS